MAQAKTRASAKRAQGRKRSPAPKKPKARPKTHSRPKSSSAGRSSNGKTPVATARQAVESSTKEAGQAVSKIASKAKSKAKTPLLAGGAALAGAAGGMAIGAMRSRQSHSHKVLGVKMPQGKRVKIRSRDVAKAAKEVGTFGQHMGELATELQHARKNSENGGKHRSPVEVVLDGLTARR